MSKSDHTKSALLEHARALFWSRGYSNVALREIARAAGVDVALISRYFGSKQGLFEATLTDLPTLDPSQIRDANTLIDVIVGMFTSYPRDSAGPSPTALILMNAGDEDVGGIVRDAHRQNWQAPLEQILGDAGAAALFSAAILGMSVAEKTMHLDGIAEPGSPEYIAQLRQMLSAALQL